MVPGVNSAEHVPPQEIPLGVLVTVPVPLPFFVIVNRSVSVAVTNRAMTVALPFRLQGPLPEQGPLQPANDEPGAAAALRDTVVPCGN